MAKRYIASSRHLRIGFLFVAFERLTPDYDDFNIMIINDHIMSFFCGLELLGPPLDLVFANALERSRDCTSCALLQVNCWTTAATDSFYCSSNTATLH